MSTAPIMRPIPAPKMLATITAPEDGWPSGPVYCRRHGPQMQAHKPAQAVAQQGMRAAALRTWERKVRAMAIMNSGADAQNTSSDACLSLCWSASTFFR